MESGNADICTSLFKEALTSVPDFEIAIACLDYSSALVDLEKMVSFRSVPLLFKWFH